MNLQRDSKIYLQGSVVRAQVGEHLDVTQRYVTLRLIDGQTIDTNVRNLCENKEDTPPAVDLTKALEEARANYAAATAALAESGQNVFKLQGEVRALKELLAAAEARADAAQAKSVIAKKRG